MKVFRNDGAVYLHQGELNFDQQPGTLISRGVVYVFDRNGILRSLLNFDEEERKSGVQIAFNENKVIIRIETWRAGILDGDWVVFDEVTGAMAEYRKYMQGKQVGAATIFDSSGNSVKGQTEQERESTPRF